MNQFRRLFDRGLDQLQGEFAEAHGEDEADEITSLVGDLNFPALLGLLGTSETAPAPEGSAALDRIAPEIASAFSGQNVSADKVRSLLTNTLLRRSVPEDVGDDRELRDKILDKAVEKLAQEAGVPVTPEQAREIAQLLATGEFFRDVGDATAAVLFLVRGLPIALRRDMRGPRRVGRVVVAIVKDAGGGIRDIPSIFADLSDGKLDDPPVILGNTLSALYGFASLGSTAEMIQELLHPDNRSVRLAIVIYARANGIPLEDGDLDVVRESLFNPENPDLGPALNRALKRMAKDHDLGQIKDILGRMSKGSDR